MRKRSKLVIDELTDEEIRDTILNMRQMNDAETRLVRLLEEVAREMDAHAGRSAADPQAPKKPPSNRSARGRVNGPTCPHVGL